jgi:hypothetical protein
VENFIGFMWCIWFERMAMAKKITNWDTTNPAFVHFSSTYSIFSAYQREL